MESPCSFLAIVGGQCGYDRRDKKKSMECIPLLSCVKDITSYKSSFAFYDIDCEVDLVLARAGIFSCPQSVEQLKICPYHRLVLAGNVHSTDVKYRRLCHITAKMSRRDQKRREDSAKRVRKLYLKSAGLFFPLVQVRSLCLENCPSFFFSI